MLSKTFVILSVCAGMFFAISGIANATNIENPVIKENNVHESGELLTFVEGMLLEHPAILSAQADVDIAKARAEGSEKPLYNPELEIEAEDASVSTYTLGITQTIDWYDKRSARYDEAEFLLQTAKANLFSVKEQVTGELIAVIVRYLSRRDMNDLTKSQVQLMDRFVQLVKRRQVAGDIGQVEVDTAQLTLTGAIIKNAEFNANLINASGDFKILTGVDVDPSLPFPTNLPVSMSKNIDVEMLAAENPLVVAAQLKVKASKARIRVTKQDRRADPSIGVTAGTEDDDTLVALRFSIPVQVRNNFRSDVTASSQEAVKEEQQAQNIYRQILGRIEATKNQYIVMSDAMQLWSQTGKKALNNHLKNLEKLWETGEISTTQYLIQVQQTLDIQLSGMKLKGDVWQAWIDWLVATGSVTKWLANTK